ncbi:unnamed protein product [Prunus armeniaca]
MGAISKGTDPFLSLSMCNATIKVPPSLLFQVGTLQRVDTDEGIVAGGDKPSNLKISGEKLEDIHIRLRTNSSGQSWNIVAPNLTYLEWIGNTINHQLGKLLHLEKGEICLVADHNSFGKVFEVFRSGPMPLDDVSYLCITIGSFKDHLAPELAYLFRRMPNLSTLRMKCNPLPESHITEDCIVNAIDVSVLV